MGRETERRERGGGWDAGGRETPGDAGEDKRGNDGLPARSGDGKVLGSTFPKRRWRLNLTVPRVIAARDPVSFVQGRENRRRFGLRRDTAYSAERTIVRFIDGWTGRLTV